MEVFEPDRGAAEVAALIGQLRGLGLRGRDAAYLASVAPPPEGQAAERARYVKEFAFMVPAEKRTAAAALLGVGALLAPPRRRKAA